MLRQSSAVIRVRGVVNNASMASMHARSRSIWDLSLPVTWTECLSYTGWPTDPLLRAKGPGPRSGSAMPSLTAANWGPSRSARNTEHAARRTKQAAASCLRGSSQANVQTVKSWYLAHMICAAVLLQQMCQPSLLLMIEHEHAADQSSCRLQASRTHDHMLPGPFNPVRCGMLR
jgi:hypothetical protein